MISAIGNIIWGLVDNDMTELENCSLPLRSFISIFANVFQLPESLFFLIERIKRILFKSKNKITLPSNKVDKRSLVRGIRNKEVRMCFVYSPISEVQWHCGFIWNFQEVQKMCQKKPMSAYPAGRAAPTVLMTAPALSRRISICDLLSSPSKPCVCCSTSLACWWSTTFAKQR